MARMKDDFTYIIKKGIHSIIGIHANYIECVYVGDRYGKRRDYELHSDHSWGTAYCEWTYLEPVIKAKLKELGAVNIIGKVRWNKIDLYFNKSKKITKS